VIAAIKENFFQREIAEASFRYQRGRGEAARDRRRQPLRARGRARLEILRIDPALEDKQIERVRPGLRGRRDSATSRQPSRS